MILDEELAKLHNVQKLDYQIYQREQTLKALDSGELLKQKAIDLLKRHDAAAAVLHKLEGAQKNAELELKGVEQKRNTVHEKLYSGRVTNPKELGDLQKDEEMLQTQIGRIEETLLGVMDEVETQSAKVTDLAGQLDQAKRRWKETVTHTQSETARLQKEIAALQPERAQKAALVDKQLLSRYDGLRQRKEGIGMSVTNSDMCPACHVKLTPQTLLHLREGEELTLCDSCGRILARSEE